MDLFRRMQIFIAVVEAGQLTRAAENLNLSKSAVSHALTDLEKHLNVQLLTRISRSWQLTDAGSTYYAQSKKILSDIEILDDRVRHNNQTFSGLIRISAPDTFGSYTLVPVLAKFMELYPDIVIEINLTDRYIDLVEKRVDLAFQTGSLRNSSLDVRTIGEAKVSILASPDYLRKYGKPESHTDLKKHKCIRYTRSPSWRFSKGGSSYEFTPKDHLMTDSGETMREFCIRGQGLAAMPSMLAKFAMRKGRLVEVLTQYESTKMPILALMLEDDRVPARVTGLLDFIVDELRSRPHDISEFIL